MDPLEEDALRLQTKAWASLLARPEHSPRFAETLAMIAGKSTMDDAARRVVHHDSPAGKAVTIDETAALIAAFSTFCSDCCHEWFNRLHKHDVLPQQLHAFDAALLLGTMRSTCLYQEALKPRSSPLLDEQGTLLTRVFLRTQNTYIDDEDWTVLEKTAAEDVARLVKDCPPSWLARVLTSLSNYECVERDGCFGPRVFLNLIRAINGSLPPDAERAAAVAGLQVWMAPD